MSENGPSFIFVDREFSAQLRRSTQIKTAPEGAAIGYVLYSYDFIRRLANPIKPVRSKQCYKTAAGMKTLLTAQDVLSMVQ